MTYTKKVALGGVIVIVFTLLNNIINYVTRMYLARNLSPSEYGLFYSVLTFVMFFLFFRDFGLGDACVKYASALRLTNKFDRIKTYFVSALIWQFINSIIFALVFFLMADWLALNYFKVPLSKNILLILLLYVVLSLLFITLKKIFSAFQKFALCSMVNVVKSAFILLFIFIFSQLGYGIFSPVWAYPIACILLFIVFMPFLLKTFNIFDHKIVDFKNITKSLFAFGVPVMLSGIGGRIISYVDTIVLTYMSTMSDVGVYNVILPSAMLFVYIGNAIAQVIFPIASELHAKNDFVKLSAGLDIMHRYTFFFVLPVIFSVFVFSEFFITFFFSSAYVVGANAFRILLIGVMLYILLVMNNALISAIGKPGTVTKIILFAALLNLVSNLILIPMYGINGAAFATSLSYGIALLISTVMVTKFLKGRLPYFVWGKLILAGVFFTYVLNFFKSIIGMNIYFNVIFSVLIAGILYVIFAYVIRIIDIKEIKRSMGFIFK